MKREIESLVVATSGWTICRLNCGHEYVLVNSEDNFTIGKTVECEVCNQTYPKVMLEELGKDIGDPKSRRDWYRNIGWSETAILDEDWRIRMEAYRHLGYREEALNDKYFKIRIEAYQQLGWRDQAASDPSSDVRKIFYDIAGYSNAFNDADPYIRRNADDEKMLIDRSWYPES